MDVFPLIVLGGIGIIVALLVLVGRLYPGSGADLLDWQKIAEEGLEPELPSLEYWTVYGACFLPGLLAGLAFGWFLIRPINAVLGWVFRGFNRFFDRMTDVYGWGIGKGLRLSAIVLLAYGGLVFFTYVLFRDSPRGR